MADVKISELTALTTPDGAEELVVNDSGTTKKITIDNLFNQDISVTGANLLPISATITDTAVDVFVYDTSKDSDGGAWRKRTQSTSWYNETLNTSTRGSRKEFPAVAVIVAESNQVTIYDGDDPAMPMWMVFSSATNNIFYSGRTPSGIRVVNGLLFCGTTDGYFSVNFPSEESRIVGSSYRYTYKGSLSQRNSAVGLLPSSSIGYIVNSTTNDIAMTVLANAPIDSATGLPIPTIAVATDGGVSVIKDDGSVVDITLTGASYDYTHNVKFSGNDVVFSNANSYKNYPYVRVVPIPSADVSYSMTGSGVTEPLYYVGTEAGWVDSLTLVGVDYNSSIKGIEAEGDFRAIGANGGLNLIKEDRTTPTSGSVAYITSDYNTGYMVGDIKLAALSDTDDTDVVGTELVTSFDDTAYPYETFASTGGTISSAINTTSYGIAVANISFVAGKNYVVSGSVTMNSGASPYLMYGSNASIGDHTLGNSSGAFSYTFIPQSGDAYIGFRTGLNNNFSATLSVRLADSDRSVNANGLQVFGTVTKSAVATGADLVAYSGFSTSNYLEQPYNSDLGYGTGDFCYTLWIKKDGAAFGYIFDRANGDGTQRVTSYFNNGDTISSYTYDGAVNDVAIPNGSWFQLVQLRSNGTMKIYINGEFKGSVATATNLSGDTNVQLKIGLRFSNVDALTDGSISLFRSSATAPTAAQIKTIYEAEKPLFQENAQATLYGTSDAVTALAHDSDTNLLHVGTSSGRSVFQGLRRVDNTTTAVGAAISAANGLVVED